MHDSSLSHPTTKVNMFPKLVCRMSLFGMIAIPVFFYYHTSLRQRHCPFLYLFCLFSFRMTGRTQRHFVVPCHKSSNTFRIENTILICKYFSNKRKFSLSNNTLTSQNGPKSKRPLVKQNGP